MSELQPVAVVEAGARALPAVTISLLNLSNILLSTTVYALTTVYILFQIIVLFPKVLKVIKKVFKKGGSCGCK